MLPATATRVAENTDTQTNAVIRGNTLANVSRYVGASKEEIARRIQQLDREWDTERLLEAQASALVTLTVALGFTRNKLWFLASGAIGGFLLQHALQGWCPPIPMIRRLGVRTAREIQQEVTALKVLRGDFDTPNQTPEKLLDAVIQ